MRTIVAVLSIFPAVAFAEETSTLLPVDLPDAEKRVIVDFEIGFNPVFGGLSGRADPFGAIPGDTTYRDSNLFLEGNAALGTNGILYPTLNIYGLGSGIFDLRGASDVPVVHPSNAYRYGDARALFLHLAYAELEGITDSGFLKGFHLRAGRQFHFSRVGLTFDGATIGYDDKGAQVAFRIGTRSAVFDRTQGDSKIFKGGLFIGGDLGYDFGPDFPLSIQAEVMHYRRSIDLFTRDDRLDPGVTEAQQRTTTGDLRIEYAPTSDTIIGLTGEFAFPALSHIRAFALFTLADVNFMIDFDQKIGRDLFYDLAGGVGIDRFDRRTTYETFRLNLLNPQPYSDLGAIVTIPLTGWLEVEPNAGFRLVEGPKDESSPFDASRARYGLNVYGNFRIDNGNGLEALAGFTGIFYLRGDNENNFRDLTSGGEDLSHEVFAGLRFVHGGGFRGRRLLSERTISIGAQGFARIASFSSRWVADPVNERVFGAGVDAHWQFTRFSGVRVAYEFARDSLLFYDYLDAFHAVRASLEASF
jgi:hypothetical protein